MSNNWHENMYDDYYADSTLNSITLKDKAKDEVRFILSKLNLCKNSNVIDIPCGTGRHSLLFAKSGLIVKGLDISNACLKIAQDQNSHENISYEIGDMGDLTNHKNSADVVVNLFSSFGYFATDRENKKVLKNFYSALKPNGRLVLNTINRDWLIKVFSKNDWHEHNGKYILNRREYNAKTHYNEAWMTVIDKEIKAEKTYYHRIRLYSKNEIVELLKEVGFKNIEVFGDAKGSRFKKYESSHPFYFAIK